MKLVSFVVPVVFGFLVLLFSVWARPEPARREGGETARPVRVIRANAVDVLTRARGYGKVVPARTWRAVARVSGTVVEMHSELKEGAIVGPDVVLLRTDPTSYELAVKRLAAALASIRGEIAQLSVQEANDRATLKIEERTLALKEKEWGRERKLFASKTVSEVSVENLEQVVLGQKARVQNVKNTLALVPAKRAVLDARLAETQAQLDQARLDVTYTVVKTPYLCRITARQAELAAYVQAGQELVVADGLGVAEVHAKISGGNLMPLVRSRGERPALTPGISSAELMQRIGFTGATVRLSSGYLSLSWQGQVDRMIGVVDATTRTVTAVVRVERHYQRARPGRRPPMIRGMLCEVELRGGVDRGRVVVPRLAIQRGEVFLVGKGNKLVRQAVQTDYVISDLAVLREGLEPGARVVVSDLSPAVTGQSLVPVVDEELEARLASQARGVEAGQ